MEFSSIVLMEVDNEDRFVRELGSYKVDEGSEFVRKFNYRDNEVSLYFDTGKDVEDWEFTAIYDVFDLEKFNEAELEIEEKDDEYNPTWVIKFDYINSIAMMEEKLRVVLQLIEEEIKSSFEEISKSKEEYIEII
ncbi:DUF6762 family protein [Clostridium sp. DL1XJH146]